MLAVLTVAILALLAAPAAEAKKSKKGKKPKQIEDLFNPLLGVEYSHWLVGPIVEIATPAEVEEYLSLIDDAEAKAFIESFWQGRNEGTGVFDKTPQQIFNERAELADKQFTEGTVSGRQTDRGKIFVVYGEPDEEEYRRLDEVKPPTPTVEVWKYSKDAEPGLGGDQPKGQYRFIEVGDTTVFYDQNALRRWQIEDGRQLRPERIR